MSDEWVDWRSTVPGEDVGPSTVQERADRAAERSESLGPEWGEETWNPPGLGESGARCSEWVVSGVCVAGHPQFDQQSCGRRSCPHCWTTWSRDAAARAALRIQAFRLTQPEDYRRQVAHAFVSPPEGTLKTAAEYWNGYGEAAEIAESKGFRGFSVVGHPWRLTQAAMEQYRAEDPDYGKWVWVREQEDTRDLIKWSPHYHVIGATSPDMEQAAEGDKWAYTWKRSLEPFDGLGDRESHEDVYGIYRYLLSHTGWPEGSKKQATRWYADLANSVFVEDASEDWQIQKPAPDDLASLEREIGAVAETIVDVDEDGAGGDVDDQDRCGCEDCNEEVVDVWDLDAHLRQREPPEDVAAAMRTARDWRLSRVEPPPGLKNPQTAEQAEEAFNEMKECRTME